MLNPTCIDQWFPVQQQRNYIAQLLGRVGLTRRRAEYFVRLWAYLWVKQQQELGERVELPIDRLLLPEGFIPCTHREAAALFYGMKDRGSDRAAGLMLDKLAALGLIKKQFDGNTICIQVRSLPELRDPAPVAAVQLQLDQFNPRTDAIPVATFLAQNYNWRYKTAAAVPHKIARILRSWSEQYPLGLRVLRRSDNGNPIGFYALYPTASASEENFFLSPRKSFHLSSAADEIDPIQMAAVGDRDCTTVFVRSWMIDQPYMQPSHLCEFLQDAQETLVRMQTDFPNLCDLQTLIIHPSYERLAVSLGFQKTGQDPQLFIYWMYLALDRFLALDMEKIIAELAFEQLTAEF
jgi:hypothetical protein